MFEQIRCKFELDVRGGEQVWKLIDCSPGVIAHIGTGDCRQCLRVKSEDGGWLLLESIMCPAEGRRYHLLSLVDGQLVFADDTVEDNYPARRFNPQHGIVEWTEDPELYIKPREYGYWQAVEGETFSMIVQSAITEAGLLLGAAGSNYENRLLLELADRLLKERKQAKVFEAAATYAAGVVGGLLDRDKRKPLASLALSGESTVSAPALAIVRVLHDLQQSLGGAGISIQDDRQLVP